MFKSDLHRPGASIISLLLIKWRGSVGEPRGERDKAAGSPATARLVNIEDLCSSPALATDLPVLCVSVWVCVFLGQCIAIQTRWSFWSQQCVRENGNCWQICCDCIIYHLKTLLFWVRWKLICNCEMKWAGCQPAEDLRQSESGIVTVVIDDLVSMVSPFNRKVTKRW